MLNRTTTSFDGVSIAYSVSGVADTALVFIHGGMADRSFWDGQHAAFEERFRVIALDLAGHEALGNRSGPRDRLSGLPASPRTIAPGRRGRRGYHSRRPSR